MLLNLKHSVSKGIMPIVCFSLPIDLYSVNHELLSTLSCQLICYLAAQKVILSSLFPVFIVLGIYNFVAPLLWARKRLRCFSPFSLLPTSLLFFSNQVRRDVGEFLHYIEEATKGHTMNKNIFWRIIPNCMNLPKLP